MAKAPQSLTIRAYQVGFGDCFLLSFRYSATSERHVLVDFGSTGLPAGVPKTRMKDIALDIRKRTGGKLHAVIATHRHRDHISGFATTAKGDGTGDIVRALKPDVVVQPWTEDPDIATDGTGPGGAAAKPANSKHVSMLAAMHGVAGQSLAETRRLGRYLAKPMRDQLGFLGEDNILNPEAVKNLMAMGKAGKAAYVYHGSKSGLDAVLPGVAIDVLGPPTLKQSDAIRKERASDPSEFWQFQSRAMRFAQAEGGHGEALFKRHVLSRGPGYPIGVRWLIFHARSARSNQLLQIVRVLDDAMNNTSVILLMEVNGKRLLFPGDAQIENWQYALSRPDAKSLLGGVNFYKVGHHGSRNATPKSLWALFKNRSKTKGPDRLQSLMSTMAGKHGSPDKKSEVPRKTLVDALKEETDLYSTQDLGAKTLYHESVIDF